MYIPIPLNMSFTSIRLALLELVKWVTEIAAPTAIPITYAELVAMVGTRASSELTVAGTATGAGEVSITVEDGQTVSTPVAIDDTASAVIDLLIKKLYLNPVLPIESHSLLAGEELIIRSKSRGTVGNSIVVTAESTAAGITVSSPVALAGGTDGTLIPNQKYAITDYQNTGSIEYSGASPYAAGNFDTFAGPVETLIVMALNESEIDPGRVTRSLQHPSHTISYIIDNDFWFLRDAPAPAYNALIDPNVTKGSIIFRRDENLAGEMFEDWFGTKFRSWITTSGEYLLSGAEGPDDEDYIDELVMGLSDWGLSSEFSLNHHRGAYGENFRSNMIFRKPIYKVFGREGCENWRLTGGTSDAITQVEAGCCNVIVSNGNINTLILMAPSEAYRQLGYGLSQGVIFANSNPFYGDFWGTISDAQTPTTMDYAGLWHRGENVYRLKDVLQDPGFDAPANWTGCTVAGSQALLSETYVEETAPTIAIEAGAEYLVRFRVANDVAGAGIIATLGGVTSGEIAIITAGEYETSLTASDTTKPQLSDNGAGDVYLDWWTVHRKLR